MRENNCLPAEKCIEREGIDEASEKKTLAHFTLRSFYFLSFAFSSVIFEVFCQNLKLRRIVIPALQSSLKATELRYDN